MAKAFIPPETGIDVMYGLPGSGKSYIAVKRLVAIMLETRRPCYTNLPLKWPVFRQYLRVKADRDLAGLVHPLGKDHFVRFIERFAERQKFLDALKSECPSMGSVARLQRWHERAGADVIDGPDANWIPAFALVVIDEIQHWFDNSALPGRAGTVKEPAALMSYLTMHRHLFHWVWCITQADRQATTTIKSLATRIWMIRKMGEDKLAWGIRFKHVDWCLRFISRGRLGYAPLGYAAYTPDQIDGKNAGGQFKGKPHLNFTEFPGVPWNQWVFRLYSSHTHAGNPRELRRQLKSARVAAGLSEKGMAVGEVEKECHMSKQRKSGCIMSTLKFTGKACIFGAVMLCVFLIGTCSGGQSVPVKDEEVKKKTEQAHAALKVRGMGVRGVTLENGVTIALGDKHDELTLYGYDVRSGISLWRHDDGNAWMWRIGEQKRAIGNLGDYLRRMAGHNQGDGEARESDAVGAGTFVR